MFTAKHTNHIYVNGTALPGKTLPFFQPKLTVNQPEDQYEQEANAIADKVMRMPEPSGNSNGFFKPAFSSVQRKCAHCEEEEKKAQRKEISNDATEASAQTENYINSLSGGSALEEKERGFFEPRMGCDFSDVRIHTGADAVKSAQSTNALAYTTGNNIIFNKGQYNPDTNIGKNLLAHELTHVVQQQHSVQPTKIQRQHIQILNNRYVGDLEGSTTNVREDVLHVMDRMHVLWSMSNTEYSADYPVVSGMAAGSHVPVASIPNTVTAIRRNEEPSLNKDAANALFSLTLSANVGTGQTNTRSDILQLQVLLNRGWHLSNPDFTADAATVSAGPDPVPEASIPNTIAAIRRLKVGYVSGTTHLSLTGMPSFQGTTPAGATERTQVEAAMVTPGSSTSPGATVADPFVNVVGGVTYWQDLITALDNYRAAQFPASASLLGRTRIGMSRFEEIANESKRQVDSFFGSYATGPAFSSTSAHPTLVDRSAQTPDARDLLNYLVNNSDELQPVRVRHHADHSRTPERDIVAALVDGCTNTSPSCPVSQVAGTPSSLPSYRSNATARAQLETIDRAWPGVTHPGDRTEIQPFSLGSNAANRRMFWEQFETMIHEYIHFIEHPTYRRLANSLSAERRSVLIEGGTSFLADYVWQRIYPSRINTEAAMRHRVEGSLFTTAADLSFIPRTPVPGHPDTLSGNYPTQLNQVFRIVSILGSAQNFIDAYFLGQTQFLGFPPSSVGSNTFTVPSSGVTTLADVSFITGVAVETIAALNGMPASRAVSPGDSLRIR